jgi:hypothetical protein
VIGVVVTVAAIIPFSPFPRIQAAITSVAVMALFPVFWMGDKFGAPGAVIAGLAMLAVVFFCGRLFKDYVLHKIVTGFAFLGASSTVVAGGAACWFYAVPFIRTATPVLASAIKAYFVNNASYEAVAGIFAALMGWVFYKLTKQAHASLSVVMLTFASGLAEAAFTTHEHLSKLDSLAGLAIYMASMCTISMSLLRHCSEWQQSRRVRVYSVSQDLGKLAG